MQSKEYLSGILAFIIKRKLLHKFAAAEQARGVNTTCHSKGPRGVGEIKQCMLQLLRVCHQPSLWPCASSTVCLTVKGKASDMEGFIVAGREAKMELLFILCISETS